MPTLNKQLSQPKTLLKLVKKQKIITIHQLKSYLNTDSRMTVFRKLKTIEYISSYSHCGKYYALKSTAKFDGQGLWKFKDVYFSKDGTLKNTLKRLISESEKGYNSLELKNILDVNVDNTLLDLLKKNVICREKDSGVFVYYSALTKIKKNQQSYRLNIESNLDVLVTSKSNLTDELQAALIIFFAILDEKQRRLYSGLESLKIGRGGDQFIADFFNINVKTVSKGRKELLEKNITTDTDTVRLQGGGRKSVKKTLT